VRAPSTLQTGLSFCDGNSGASERVCDLHCERAGEEAEAESKSFQQNKLDVIRPKESRRNRSIKAVCSRLTLTHRDESLSNDLIREPIWQIQLLYELLIKVIQVLNGTCILIFGTNSKLLKNFLKY